MRNFLLSRMEYVQFVVPTNLEEEASTSMLIIVTRAVR